MDIDFDRDPVLALRRRQTDRESFRAVMEAAIDRHPALLESEALKDVAEVRVRQEQSGRLPSLDASVSSYRVLSRDFSNDPSNIIERSRPRQRTDAQLSLSQTVLDFGATEKRIEAAKDRRRAASADSDGIAERVALATVSAWYELFGMRALVGLATAFGESQRDLRHGVEQRIREGASAESDLARVDSYIANADRQIAGFRRAMANAEARFRELTGAEPPEKLDRAPVPAMTLGDRASAADAGRAAPEVRSAEASAQAARGDAGAVRASKLPNVSAGIDAGRYGVIENDRDYDVRFRVTLRQRLFGGTDPRTGEYAARVRAADARFQRVREESARDAAIAWSDVQALEQQLAALESAYIASRRSRDVIAERFRLARGSLLDVLGAQDAYFASAAAYIQGLTELDAARYVLLARTGRLSRELGVDPEAKAEAKDSVR
ncbi:TolC family protein [Sphingomonas sp.]|jgi:adhesin transport system outer membrane protein|uniref:TolC family protein n=1 Tax=Sphingomonas sp. TaxID=28214 RepID=UPI002ED9D8E5